MTRMLDPTYVRYGLVSLCALGADVGLFTALLTTGLMAGLASGAGYTFGIAIHWLMSSRLVFARETAAQGSPERRHQKLLFTASALLGLGLTMGIVGTGSTLGLDPHIAKLIAIGISFQSVWLVRRLYVFTR